MEGESPEQWGLEVEGGWEHTEWQDYSHSPAISTQWVPPAQVEPQWVGCSWSGGVLSANLKGNVPNIVAWVLQQLHPVLPVYQR